MPHAIVSLHAMGVVKTCAHHVAEPPSAMIVPVNCAENVRGSTRVGKEEK